MVVVCLTGGQTERYRVEISGLVSLNFDTKPYYIGRAYLDEPWNYIELTSIEATGIQLDGHDVWRVEAEIWTSTLEIVCRDIIPVCEMIGLGVRYRYESLLPGFA
jgi:hypothetical protein